MVDSCLICRQKSVLPLSEKPAAAGVTLVNGQRGWATPRRHGRLCFGLSL